MLRNLDTTQKADLRKKSSIKDEFTTYDIQTCMVMLVVMTVLLFLAVSVAVAQNPSFI